MDKMLLGNRRAIAIMRVAIILTAIIATIVLQTPVLATVSQPDSTPTISNTRVNKNLITTGDICFYTEYTLPYTTTPDTPADDAYIFRLMHTDNSTEIGSVSPYVYFDNGYTFGVISFYFEDYASEGIEWGTGYTIRISQNPGQFTSPTYWDYVIPASAYTSDDTQADNQEDMAARIVMMARDMQEEFTDYDFLEQSASGTVLSVPEGATYFRGAIPGLQNMAPSLFLIESLAIDWSTTENWSTTQADNYTGRFSGTWVGTSENATADRFGITTGMLNGIIFILPICVGVVALSQIRYKKTEPGLIASIPLIVMGFTMGWLPAAITATVFQLTGMYIAYLFFYSRS